MRGSDDLYKLVKSLTKSEKRYFKLFSSIQSGEKKYLLLFEAMDQQDEYDEAAIKEQFKNEKFVKQFNVAKNYLYNLILRSMRVFHASVSTSLQIKELLQNVRMLQGKGLNDQAYKMLDKAKEHLEQGEQVYLAIEVLDTELTLRPELCTTHEAINDRYAAIFKRMDQLREIFEYRKLQHHSAVAIINHGLRTQDDLECMQSIINNPLMLPENEPQLLRSKVHYNWIYAIYYFSISNYEESLKYSESIVELFHQNRDYMADRLGEYASQLSNCITIARRLQDNEKFWNLIEMTRNSSETLVDSQSSVQTNQLVADIFTYTHLNILSFGLGTGQYHKSLAYVDDILNGLKKHHVYISEEYKNHMYYEIGALYFSIGDYRQALDYINKILMASEPARGAGTYYAAHIQALIIHFEMGNFDLLEYQVPSTQRYLSTRSAVHKVESIVLEFFRKLPSTLKNNKLTDAFQRLHDQLLPLTRDPLEVTAFKLFAYIPWINSKLQGITYEQAALTYYCSLEKE